MPADVGLVVADEVCALRVGVRGRARSGWRRM